MRKGREEWEMESGGRGGRDDAILG